MGRHPDLRPTPDRADELVRMVRAGNHPMLLELAELGTREQGTWLKQSWSIEG